MNLITYPDRAAWLAARNIDYSIGGSDVAAILGVSPWATPWDVFARKTAGIYKERTDEERAILARGHRFEPVVISEYEHAMGIEVTRHDFAIMQHPEHAWMVGSPDGLVTGYPPENDGWWTTWGVEAKTATRTDGWGLAEHCVDAWEGDGITHVKAWTAGAERIVPANYALQCYWYLAISGLQWWDIAVLLPRYDLRIIRLYHDEATQAAIIEKVAAWRERHLVGGEPPDADGSEAMRAWLTQRFPGDPAKEAVKASLTVEDLAWAIRAAQEAEKAASATVERLKGELAMAMGDTYKAISDHGSVVYTLPSDRVRIDGKRLRRDHPEIVKEYEVISNTSRSVRLYGFKGE